MSTRARFIKLLKQASFPSVFNPYTDRCKSWDLYAAPRIRVRNLEIFMEAVEGSVESIWFGRDLGYLGGRRTGLALTDEAHLEDLQNLSGSSGLHVATSGPMVAERTATTTWNVLRQLRRAPFLWNIFPFHPYSGDDQRSNRCHTRNERIACTHILNMLLEWAPSARLIAIGHDSNRGLREAGLKCTLVRHPSYGGKAEFVSGIRSIYADELSTAGKGTQHDLF
jgi:hypothetical protein